MARTAEDVAKLFIYLANFEGDPVTQLKLQKLLYYAQAWHLVNYHKPLFADPILHWKYGPVVDAVYHAHKQHGANPIKPTKGDDETSCWAPFSSSERYYLREFFKRFYPLSLHELVNMSHRDEPWQETRKDEEISTAKMKKFYTEMYKRSQKKL